MITIDRKMIFTLVLGVAIMSPLWVRAISQTVSPMVPASQSVIDTTRPALVSVAPVTTPGASAAATSSTGFSVGQAFGYMQPYIDSLISTLILAGVGAVAAYLRRKFNINLDESQRGALTTFLQNAAASLIADGMVKMQGVKITVDPVALEAEANHAANVIPEALVHWKLDGPKGIEPLKAKIVNQIPQTAAGAAIVAQAHKPTPTAVVVPANAIPQPAA